MVKRQGIDALNRRFPGDFSFIAFSWFRILLLFPSFEDRRYIKNKVPLLRIFFSVNKKNNFIFMHNKRNFIKFFSFRNRVGKRSEKKISVFPSKSRANFKRNSSAKYPQRVVDLWEIKIKRDDLYNSLQTSFLFTPKLMENKKPDKQKSRKVSCAKRKPHFTLQLNGFQEWKESCEILY